MNFNDSNIQNLCKTQNIHHRLDIAMDQLQSGYENFVQYYASLAITNEVLYMYGSEIKDELINIPWFGESSLYFDNYQ